ncbi:GFA family protein [Streptomyces atratus]|uniref:GFA family protein n=1 Tax=Streptomyces atratus TaxID=1893 RepID=UPI00364B95AF
MADDPTPEVFTGGCLCGQIRFETTGEPYDPHLCSCPHCTRLSGGPFMGWVGFHRTAFTWTGPGTPASFRSWPTLERWFCPMCGTPLGAAGDREDYLGICLSALDNCVEIIPSATASATRPPHGFRPSPLPNRRPDLPGPEGVPTSAVTGWVQVTGLSFRGCQGG